MSAMDRVQQLEQQRDELRRQLAAIDDMRPGTLRERFRRCGKPNCRCAQPDAEAHGPVWSLTWAVAGRTHTKVIPAGAAVERTQAQIAEFRRFRNLTQQLLRLSEQLCDARLGEGQAEAQATAKKGGSKRASTRRSVPSSKRS